MSLACHEGDLSSEPKAAAECSANDCINPPSTCLMELCHDSSLENPMGCAKDPNRATLKPSIDPNTSVIQKSTSKLQLFYLLIFQCN